MSLEVREALEALNEEAYLLPEEFDTALTGYIKQWNAPIVAVYNAEKIVSVLTSGAEKMSEEDAWDHYYFNIEGSYLGENTPLFLHTS